MGYRRKMTMMLLVDMFLVCAAVFTGKMIIGAPADQVFVSALLLMAGYYVFAFYYGLYKKAWSYASIGDMLALIKTITLSAVITGAVQWLFLNPENVRHTIVAWQLLLIMMGTIRLSERMLRDVELVKSKRKKRTLIVGAGSAGTLVVRQLLRDRQTNLVPAAFVDDDPRKHQLQLLGVPVAGSIGEIEKAVTAYKIDHIVIAIPSLGKEELDRVRALCAKTNVRTQILPRIEQLILDKGTMPKLQDIQPEALLAREPVTLNTEEIAGSITGKVVLVTGAGGSIGSEICRQLSVFKPSQLLLLGHGENSIYSIEMELREAAGDDMKVVPIIADIQDRARIFRIMDQYRPAVVYHAAAHKHVPLMEANPHEAVKNNVIGTKNVAEAAAKHGVQTFVMVSSDKAVKPTSVMGATKRVAELLIQQMDRASQTRFVAVRFGNVLGSRGSVIPLFKSQIERGGPVTITHPDMERYFMTIPEASRLVIQAGALAKGGEIFVLDMGEPVKITDLAKNLIQLSGYTLDEIGIRYTGMRPGEKMYEELLDASEIHEKQIYPKIYIGKSTVQDMKWVEYLLVKFTVLEERALAALLLDIAHNRVNSQPNLIAASQ
ncbi:nucleoside-diphosphate sugar epimerase/dehydratase [Domibacillus sp. DTU_2020_1001157_1_SI_ALB_TIR_016]|uniref:polysaccharide biosynthesis protein n=1 Tax=Domibacillus sp. DTU_2020_1001157_1_SI_ALB_TIR_016 TaxID=3077789 RepID=UPI0028EBEA0E|nr:nucleoside-diphosphate sugar epimerase/dehydratase [Domibacillus sp. DTU_2020_1001157_1_SI_ALB_TIR_016]WNS81203.1 nucleoside-diphosphate sugar epimerase/dehydratase [Domibacillus sp. DTU_2020_1001157_1_SI_ALB_TIR_016]